MTEKGKRQWRRDEEDAAFNRMLLWLCAAVAAEIVILLVRHFYVDINSAESANLAVAMRSFFGVFRYVGIALAAVFGVWTAAAVRKKRRASVPAACTAVAVVLWLIALLAYQLYDQGMRILMVLPAVAGILILIYFLYQRAFFCNAVLTGGGLAALWLYRQYYVGHPARVTACFVAGWVLLALAALAAQRLSKSGGKLGARQIVPEDTPYATIYLSCGITAAAMAAGIILGATAAFYLIFVLMAWLFCQAVYFTVKLM